MLHWEHAPSLKIAQFSERQHNRCAAGALALRVRNTISSVYWLRSALSTRPPKRRSGPFCIKPRLLLVTLRDAHYRGPHSQAPGNHQPRKRHVNEREFADHGDRPWERATNFQNRGTGFSGPIRPCNAQACSNGIRRNWRLPSLLTLHWLFFIWRKQVR